MVTDKIRELEAARAKLAQLEEAVAAELRSELSGLPARYGFESAKAFVDAVLAAAGSRGKRRGRPPGRKAGSKPAATTGRRRKKRSVITDETRAEVKMLAGQGKTGNEIAKAVGISLPSVQNIKKALGLVVERSPKKK